MSHLTFLDGLVPGLEEEAMRERTIEEVITALEDFLLGKEVFMAQEDLRRLIEAYRVQRELLANPSFRVSEGVDRSGEPTWTMEVSGADISKRPTS